LGVGGGLATPLEKNFKIKVLFLGFDVEKRKFSVVACRFGCVQFKAFSFLVFLKTFILSTAVKLTI